MNKLITVCVALVFAASTVACGKSGGDAKVDEPKTEQKDGAKKDDGAAKKEAKTEAKDPKKEEKAPAGKTGGMTADMFADKAPTALCEWLTSCKNEEITTGVQTMMVMMVAFGAMAKPEMKDDIEKTMGGMKDKKGSKLDMAQCGAISGLGAKLIGLNKETLGESVKAKRVTFDAAKATACLEGFKNVKACETEKKVEGEPKMSEVDKMMEPYKEDLEKLGKTCEGVLVGQVDKDAACMNDYECKEGLSCKGAKPGDKEMKCQGK
ncbi:MAG: hypothetical protein AAFX99_13550 [Myxococcota bacterium]